MTREKEEKKEEEMENKNWLLIAVASAQKTEHKQTNNSPNGAKLSSQTAHSRRHTSVTMLSVAKSGIHIFISLPRALGIIL